MTLKARLAKLRSPAPRLLHCRIPSFHRLMDTPAMETGSTDHVWELTELRADSETPMPKKRMNNTHQ